MTMVIYDHTVPNHGNFFYNILPPKQIAEVVQWFVSS